MRKALLAFLFLILVIPVSAQRRGAGGPVTFAVFVSDPSGAPIPDVKVTLSGTTELVRRTEGGRALFEGLRAGAYSFRFEKTGFEPLEREFTGRGGTPVDVRVTLTPLPPPPPPPPPPAPVAAAEPSVTPKLVVLDMPAFIEKNYIGKASGKMTPLGCGAGGAATLVQINEPIAEHAHNDADEFVYVIAGKGEARLAGRQEPLGPAVFMMIPQGMPHTIIATKKPLVLISTRAGEKCAP
jgi:hypothetical protein